MHFQIRQLPRIRTYWILTGLMFIGLALRVRHLGAVPFNIDEAILCLKANAVAHLREFPAMGVRTSFGFHNPPLFIYLMSPCFAFTGDPRFAVFALAMIGSLAVGVVGLTARRLWGGWAAVLAGALVCFSPTAIEHSRRLWGHDTIIFWSALAAYGTVRGIQSPRRQFLWLALGASVAAAACHLSGALVALLPLGAIMMFRPPGWKRALVVGAAIAALIYLPWLIADAKPDESGRRFAEVRLLANLATGHAQAPPSDASPASAWESWLCLLADTGHIDLLGEESARFYAERPALHIVVVTARIGFAALQVLAVGALLFTAMRRHIAITTRRVAWLLAAAVLAPFVLFTLLPVTVVPPYQLPAFVPSVLAVAWLVTRFTDLPKGITFREQRQRPLRGRCVGAALLLIVCCAVYARWFVTAERRFVLAATPDMRVTTPLSHKLSAIQEIVGRADGGKYAISQDGRSPASGIDYWLLYLHYYVSEEDYAPTDPLAARLFIVRDSNTVLRPESAVWLDRFPAQAFGNLRVYELGGEATREWRQWTDRYSSARPVKD